MAGEGGCVHAPLVSEGIRPPHKHDDARVQRGLLGGQTEGRLGGPAGHFLMMSSLLCLYGDNIIKCITGSKSFCTEIMHTKLCTQNYGDCTVN